MIVHNIVIYLYLKKLILIYIIFVLEFYKGDSMKTIILIIACISALFAEPPVEFDKEKYKIGEMVFDNKCSSCHEKSMDMRLTNAQLHRKR